MDPARCFVLDGEDRWPSKVLAWVHDALGLARGRPVHEAVGGGLWPMGYEHAIRAARVLPRSV